MIPLVKPFLPPKEALMPRLEKILYSGYIAEGAATAAFEQELTQLLASFQNLLTPVTPTRLRLLNLECTHGRG